jgi:uncharacterized protein (DUF1501 family)
MSHELTNACPEYQMLSRRGFLQSASVGAAALAAAPAWLPKVAFAKGVPDDFRDVIVSIYLRGACDGLSMIVPFDDPTYTSAACRPTLRLFAPDQTSQPAGRRCIAVPNCTFVSGRTTFNFGFNPSLSPLLPAYLDGKLAVIHACGLTGTNKSHFDAQRWMENGLANSNNIVTGWLGRHLATKPPVNPHSAVRAIGVADGLQRTLEGAPNALPIPQVQTNPGVPPLLNNLAAISATNSSGYGLTGATTSNALRRAVLDGLYDLSPEPLNAKANSTLATIDRLNAIGAAGYTPAGGAVYPTTSLGYALRTSAALIASNNTTSTGQFTEAIAIDQSGWDTHQNQAAYDATSGVFTGTIVNLMTTLSQALAAFYTDVIATRQANVTVVVHSEFGRRVGENGSLGTDHGYGNVMFVMGKAILGGRLVTVWPGLPSAQPLTNQDIPVTTDIRHILAEIIDKRLTNGANLPFIFPNFVPFYRGICL